MNVGTKIRPNIFSNHLLRHLERKLRYWKNLNDDIQKFKWNCIKCNVVSNVKNNFSFMKGILKIQPSFHRI